MNKLLLYVVVPLVHDKPVSSFAAAKQPQDQSLPVRSWQLGQSGVSPPQSMASFGRSNVSTSHALSSWIATRVAWVRQAPVDGAALRTRKNPLLMSYGIEEK